MIRLNYEQLRILRAARDGHLRMTTSGRYEIDGGRRPTPSTRARLQDIGYLPHLPPAGLVALTDAGRDALRERA